VHLAAAQGKTGPTGCRLLTPWTRASLRSAYPAARRVPLVMPGALGDD